MLDRIGSWLGWSVLIALVPYAGLLLLRVIKTSGWPSLEVMFGSGQLLLTSAALLAGGLKEMTLVANDVRRRMRNFTTVATMIVVIMTALAYGGLANDAISGSPLTSQQQWMVTAISIGALVVSVLVAGIAVAISTPPGTESKATVD